MENKKIRVAIAGYGNLGKGIESQLPKHEDMELVCIFTRRNPDSLKIKSNVPVIPEKEMESWKDKIDLVFLCGGSATDLPVQGPKFASVFNTVDSYDTHAKALDYYKKMDETSRKNDFISMMSIGWDPGLFSIMRLLFNSILPNSRTYTFWGPGVSQGHSDAIRRIDGVLDARQYTIPVKNSVDQIRNGQTMDFTARQMHERVCYVVADPNADKTRIENEIKNMPNYFDEYNTTVYFISQEELLADHSRLPHGGSVLNIAQTSKETNHVTEFSLKLDSNPEFASSVIITYGRAAYRMWKNGHRGCKNFSDVAPKYLSTLTYSEIIKTIL